MSPDNHAMTVLLRALCCALALAGQSTRAQGLPAEVESALARAKVPREALSVLVLPAQDGFAE